MNLVIVESPGKIKKITEYLGPGWRVEASVGHVRDLPRELPRGETGVEPPDFRPQYVPTERGKGVIAKLKKAAAEADMVYLATDPDREGEAIAWHLKDALGLKTPTRITFGEITKTAVKDALQNPRTIDMRLVAAQEARRTLDRHVGYLVSPVLRNQSGADVSAGRVQSVAVRLVVERKRAIDAFKVTTHYGVQAMFEGWSAEWKVKPLLAEGQEYWLDMNFALGVASVRDFAVVDFKEQEARRAPPAPFITSTLQQAASNKLKFDPDVTMKLAQRLYEQGAISYMRTDNPNLSADALTAIYETAQLKGLPMADEARRWKAKDGAQEAHEAIRPTHFDVEAAGENAQEQALYRLIWERAFASQLADARYDSRSVKLSATHDGRGLLFEASGRTLRSKGWLAIQAGDDSEEDECDDAANVPVPALTVGQTLKAADAKLLTKKTKAPKQYTLASLIKDLESRGIGRPATYAAILQNITARGYIKEVTGRKLDATDLGCLIVDGMVGTFQFMEYGFTRDLEADLDRIAEGATDYRAVVSGFYYSLKDELGNVRIQHAPTHPCPDCGKGMRRIAKGANGPFWGCSGFPECKTTLPDAGGKPGKKEEADAKHACPQCTKPLTRRTKKGKDGFDFWGCSGFPACKARFPNGRGKPVLNG